VKAAIRKKSVNGLGIRYVARCLGVDKNRVMAELKKESDISNVNTEYFKCRNANAIKSVLKWMIWENSNYAYYKRIDAEK
jgi:hypothetical protein